MRLRFVLTAGLVAALIAGAACGDDDGGGVREVGDASGSGSGSGSGSASGSGSGSGPGSGEAECKPVGDPATATATVNVTLDEYAVGLDPATVPAGNVMFVAADTGEEVHEVVIVRGVAPGDLPVDGEGKLDEEQLPGGALIGEIEPFPAGETCDGTFPLTAGEYSVLCNLVDDEDGAHLQAGMVTSLIVT